MPHYKYLIVGGGMTADAAVHGIREVDHEGSIGVIGSESQPPYKRPPLSKSLWKGKPLESIWLKAAAETATLHLGRRAVGLEPERRRVVDDKGTVYEFDKLLLATGGTPRELENAAPGVIYFRTADDYTRLRVLTTKECRVAVAGGGFIGSEIAAALAMNGMQVVLVFPEKGICGRMFPNDLVQFLNDHYRQQGIEVRPGEKIKGVEARGSRYVMKVASENGREDEITVDAVVAGLGIRANTELAEAAGLATGDGIRVDRSLCTSQPNIYAAGDVAEFHNPALDRYMRVEHEDNANTMGKAAGRAMAGERVFYDHLPFFYSDLFELGYEAVGEIDSRLETVADWKKPFQEGVIYYLRNGRVRGVLLWNVWKLVDAARELIAERGPFSALNLRGRLFEAPQHV